MDGIWVLSHQGDFVEQFIIYLTSLLDDDGERGKNILGHQICSDAEERVRGEACEVTIDSLLSKASPIDASTQNLPDCRFVFLIRRNLAGRKQKRRFAFGGNAMIHAISISLTRRKHGI